ncbi:MAG: zf-HC2 domain-containing protein [Bacillota bacterium]
MTHDQTLKCAVIQDLLPIYADGELSALTESMVREHLVECEACRLELEAYRRPLFTGLVDDSEKELFKSRDFFGLALLPGLRRVAWIGVVAILIGASSLAFAAFKMGQSIALQDPVYKRAVKEDLFLRVHQTKQLGPYEVTVSRLLLDNTQTVVFYNTSPALEEQDRLQIVLKDQENTTYELLSGFSYGGKEHVMNMQAVDPTAQELNIEFQLEGTPAEAVFKVAVDPAAVQASTSQWWPGIKREIGPVRIDLERVILGLTKSQVSIRALWPLDAQIRGIGLGKLPPLGPIVGEDGRVRSAGGGFFNVSREARDLPLTDEYASMIDLTNKRHIKIQSIGYQTDSFTGGITATFDFESISEPTSQIQFSLPQLYLYKNVKTGEEITISLEKGQEQEMEWVFKAGNQEVIIKRIFLDEHILSVEYHIPSGGEGSMPDYLPELVLVSEDGFDRQGRLTSAIGSEGSIEFYVNGDGPWKITLNSLGELLSGNRKFALNAPSINY